MGVHLAVLNFVLDGRRLLFHFVLHERRLRQSLGDDLSPPHRGSNRCCAFAANELQGQGTHTPSSGIIIAVYREAEFTGRACKAGDLT